ncbi:MAG: class II aldolase/adducin family protein [Armatimonadota bacterium]|nr:class II aldolase/adducin family protein [Armatimonadota bacterium]
MDNNTVLDQLVRMSLNLGKPENEYAILGEGNTSARVDEETFYVKQSGSYLCTAACESFVHVRFAPVLAMIEESGLSDDEIKGRLMSARADSSSPSMPSIETVFHAYLLTLPGVSFVGHTHPIAVNSLLCSHKAKEAFSGRVFPDEIVFCGIEPVYMEYVDPGPALARAIREHIQEFMDKQGVTPKVVYMQNHGVIALGANPQEVEAITAMAVKTCRVLAGTYIFGGPRFLTKENVDRIYTRPDEEYRKRQFRQ